MSLLQPELWQQVRGLWSTQRTKVRLEKGPGEDQHFPLLSRDWRKRCSGAKEIYRKTSCVILVDRVAEAEVQDRTPTNLQAY